MIRNIFVLASGSALSQAILIITLPIISRIYSSEDFGIYAIYMGILAIISPFSTLRYETAILFKDNNHPTFTLLLLTTFIAMISSLGVLLIGYIAIVGLEFDFNEEILILLVMMFFLGGISESLLLWHLRDSRYIFISFVKFAQAIITVTSQIFLFKFFEGNGLFYGYFIGLLFIVLIYIFYIIFKDYKILNVKQSMKFLKIAMVEHKKFPIFSTWTSIINTSANNITSILIGYFFSASAAGNFEMSKRLTRAPMALLGQSIYRVSAKEVGALSAKKAEAGRFLFKQFKNLCLITFIPFAFAILYFEELFILFLGEEWINAGVYAKAIAPWTYVVFISWPVTSAYNTFGYQSNLFLFNLGFLTSIVVVFIIHQLIVISLVWVLVLISILMCLMRLWYCFWIFHNCNVKNLYKSALLFVSIVGLIQFTSLFSLQILF